MWVCLLAESTPRCADPANNSTTYSPEDNCSVSCTLNDSSWVLTSHQCKWFTFFRRELFGLLETDFRHSFQVNWFCSLKVPPKRCMKALTDVALRSAFGPCCVGVERNKWRWWTKWKRILLYHRQTLHAQVHQWRGSLCASLNDAQVRCVRRKCHASFLLACCRLEESRMPLLNWRSKLGARSCHFRRAPLIDCGISTPLLRRFVCWYQIS